MPAAAADGDALAGLVGVVRGDVGAEDPGLEHGAGLAVLGGVGESGGDADDGGTIDSGRALIKDVAVFVVAH